jgi:hypothetical protein
MKHSNTGEIAVGMYKIDVRMPAYVHTKILLRKIGYMRMSNAEYEYCTLQSETRSSTCPPVEQPMYRTKVPVNTGALL